MIGFVEGREAANPWWPGKAPVDAYCSLIVDTVDYRPGRRVELMSTLDLRDRKVITAVGRGARRRHRGDPRRGRHSHAVGARRPPRAQAHGANRGRLRRRLAESPASAAYGGAAESGGDPDSRSGLSFAAGHGAQAGDPRRRPASCGSAATWTATEATSRPGTTTRWVICTPTLMSKADMTIDDLCMVDLEGVQVAGRRARSSEILLHLSIMKAVPEAQAVLHCHPPHATAYAISGVVPPNCIIPEQEVFVGAVALSPYETPGTPAFAETVLPYVKHHNTVLLANHGIVCWADTVTHAEWYAEVVDTYCQTLVIASHLGKGPTQISGPKTAALLDIKKRLGLPDSRFGLAECQLCDVPELTAASRPPALPLGVERRGRGVGRRDRAPRLPRHRPRHGGARKS